VPEVGQGGKIHREEVCGLWDTMNIWTMPVRVDDK
jgi:hypothetical protein